MDTLGSFLISDKLIDSKRDQILIITILLDSPCLHLIDRGFGRYAHLYIIILRLLFLCFIFVLDI